MSKHVEWKREIQEFKKYLQHKEFNPCIKMVPDISLHIQDNSLTAEKRVFIL